MKEESAVPVFNGVVPLYHRGLILEAKAPANVTVIIAVVATGTYRPWRRPKFWTSGGSGAVEVVRGML